MSPGSPLSTPMTESESPPASISIADIVAGLAGTSARTETSDPRAQLRAAPRTSAE
jgi:hypothetical protein